MKYFYSAKKFFCQVNIKLKYTFGKSYFLYLQAPSTSQDWLQIADGFQQRWNMPHVLGAVDGKHIRIRCPRSSGSLYFNYKGYFSVVLMAVVDHDYRFIFVDVGAEGRASDSRIWRQSQFFHDIDSEANVLDLPQPAVIPGIRGPIPYYFVADDAFALGIHMLKPFPGARLSYCQRVFNYRLSRCRRIVENAFGILATRFRILLRQQDMEPEGVKILVITMCALHNFLRTRCAHTYMPLGSVDHEMQDHSIMQGQWRNERQLDRLCRDHMVRNPSFLVKHMRLALAQWCVTKYGEVPWQYRIVPGNMADS